MRGGRFGRGYGAGRGRWGYGVFGASPWPGNPYPYCRNFPWLPRGWWWTGAYGYGRLPYYGGYRGYPYPPASYQAGQA